LKDSEKEQELRVSGLTTEKSALEAQRDGLAADLEQARIENTEICKSNFWNSTMPRILPLHPEVSDRMISLRPSCICAVLQ
jgi:hypothetical protein